MCRISIPLTLLALALFAALTRSALAQETKPAAKAAPARASAASAKPTVEIVRMPSDILQRRRQGIAKMLEGNLNYRGMLAGGAAKIVNAKLAGPFEHTITGMFSGQKFTRTLYCVTATLVLPLNVDPVALITVQHPTEGGERMTGKITRYMPSECRNADFKPFPEMERLRVQRRRALGHAD
jgi:hypothetical protein